MRDKLDLSVVDVEDFLEHLRVRNLGRASLDHWRFSCPFPGHSFGDENPSAQMRDDSTAWNCFGCKRHGNAITFLAEYEGVTFMEARRWIREQYGGGFVEPEEGAEAEWLQRFREIDGTQEVGQTYLDESALENFAIDWDDAFERWVAAHRAGEEMDPVIGYMFGRGFGPQTLDEWEIGYDPWGQRFTIPVRDVDGRLVGFKGRSWDPERKPKYRVLGDKPGRSKRYFFPTYEKSMVVFGLDRAKATGRLIVVEGELNCISMHAKGWEDTVAIAGSDLSEHQARLIRDHCDEVLVFFDTDDAGREAAWGRTFKGGRRKGAVDVLEPHMRVLVAPDHEGDPADMSQEDIAACLAGVRGSVAARAALTA